MTSIPSKSIFLRVLIAAILLLMLQACKQESAERTSAESEGAPAAGIVTEQPEIPAEASSDGPAAAEYDWYMESSTPAGRTAIVNHGDGKYSSDSFIHWNNREWTIKSELQLDEAGLPISQRITGISPFQAPIDESFDWSNDQASWSTVGEKGEMNPQGPGFYLPSESGAFESLAALVRASQASLDGEVPLLPSGKARVEKVSELEVDTGDGMKAVSLYSISGINFTPSYLWMDENLELVALDSGGYLGMIPKGWDPAVLQVMSKAQLDQSARYIEQLAGRLGRTLDTPLIFENVDVVDVATGELLEDRHVRTDGGKITDISQQSIPGDDAMRIDGTGRTLIPGLWDMHGHFSLSDGVLNIAGGITSVRDIGSVHDQIMETTAKYDSGDVIGPHTYRAGFMDKAGPYASGWAAETLEEALDRVDFFADNGYIQIKLYSSIDPGWVAPIAERTHGHGMRLSGHIPAFMSAEQAVKAGYDEIQHINMVFLNFLVGDKGDTRQQIRFTTYGDEAANLDLDSEEVESFIALLKENDVVVDATAAIFDTMLTHQTGVPDPTFALVIEHLPPAVRRPMYNPEMVMGENWPASGEKQMQMLKKLHDSGVQLVPGSDSIAAFTMHRELEVYVEAGIPNADVLRIATLDSARVVGVDEKTGSIAEGKDSDLILVDGNPLEDISAVRSAVLVMKGDTVYRPDVLYEAVGVEPFVPSVTF